MVADTKTAAERQRRLLIEGLVSLSRVQAWADEQIAELAEPPYWLIAVSMAKSTEDAVAALGDVRGTADATAVWRALTEAWLELLQADPDRDSEIAKRLYFIGVEGRSPIAGIDEELMSFWDAIDLAIEGVYGFREAERAKLRAFLARWTHPRANK